MSSSSTKFGRTAWTLGWEGIGRSFARSPLSPFFTKRPFHFTSTVFPQFRPITQHNVRRHCSSGLLLLGLDASTPTSQTIVSSCNAASSESNIAGRTSRAGTASRQAWQAWVRNMHTARGSPGRMQRRLASTKPEQDNKAKAQSAQPNTPSQSQAKSPKIDPKTLPNKAGPHHDSLTDSVSKYLHLPHLPKMPQRPTKEELLSAASGFWERLRVRFKWFSIRSTRPFNADEWGAFLSWIIFGHFVWILVGTTTFFSLVILTVNTVFAQGTYFTWKAMALEFLTDTFVFRNPCAMDWRLPYKGCWRYRRLRIGNCAQMG